MHVNVNKNLAYFSLYKLLHYIYALDGVKFLGHFVFSHLLWRNMGLRPDKVLEMKLDFELGLMTRVAIAKKYGVSRPTVNKHAKDGNWKYQHAYEMVAEEAQKKMVSNLLDRNTDLMESVTNGFLNNVERYKRLVMMPLNVLEDKYGGQDLIDVPKEEFDRLFTGAKLAKISIEALTIVHTATRMALGMDKDQEIRKAREIHNDERNNQLVDPLEGMSTDQVKTELNQLRSRKITDITMEIKDQIDELSS